MDNATTSKSLNNTANAIIQRGWWNQNLPKYSGARCGNAICAGLAMPIFVMQKFAEYLGMPQKSNKHFSSFVYDWNDAQDNPEIVIKTLREAAAHFAAIGE